MSSRTIGPYTLARSIGRGGMGEVFEARDPGGRRLAVKTLRMPEAADPSDRWRAVERFQREARAARSLEHPNIVSVTDVGEDQGTFYIAMEYIDGQSVRDLLEMAGALSLQRATEIVCQVCGALAYAHERAVVHRDIKPDNIMVLKTGNAKLTDFGIAAVALESGVTATGTILGTLYYMSPEQAQGHKVDARSDIFSLGATFYEMITGRVPFSGSTAGEIVASILNSEPPPITETPPDVQRLILRCLRKDREQRVQRVSEIAACLRQTTQADATQSLVVESSPALRKAEREEPAPPPRVVLDARRQLHVDINCPKCGEPWVGGRVTCWNCGAPDPRRLRGTTTRSAQEAVLEAVRGLAPRRKRWWQLWR